MRAIGWFIAAHLWIAGAAAQSIPDSLTRSQMVIIVRTLLRERTYRFGTQFSIDWCSLTQAIPGLSDSDSVVPDALRDRVTGCQPPVSGSDSVRHDTATPFVLAVDDMRIVQADTLGVSAPHTSRMVLINVGMIKLVQQESWREQWMFTIPKNGRSYFLLLRIGPAIAKS